MLTAHVSKLQKAKVVYRSALRFLLMDSRKDDCVCAANYGFVVVQKPGSGPGPSAGEGLVAPPRVVSGVDFS